MTETNEQPSNRLTEFLAKINMSELPAMSNNVQELISLTHSASSATYELSKVILKDYSLTNKVLQVVNSAYYSIGRRVSSISRAVTVLGFDAVRDVSMAIALFEDFVKAGLEKEEISKVMTRAFISAVHSRDLAVKKNLNVIPEEAFICSLLHNLGKTIVCIYAPDMYRDIQRLVEEDKSESDAAMEVLDMSYFQLGEEIAKFWNLSDQIVSSMEYDPVEPVSNADSFGYLRSLADYSNRLVDSICAGDDLDELFEKYGSVLQTDVREAIEDVKQNLEASEDVSDSLRYGLTKLRIRSRIAAVEKEAKSPKKRKKKEAKKADEKEAEVVEQMDELPISKDKSVNDFIHDMTETLMGSFDLNEFYVQLLEALYQGVGFDRVILAIMEIKGQSASLVGRFGLGDIDASKITEFRHSMKEQKLAIPQALKTGKDMFIPAGKKSAFPRELHMITKGRNIYLLPIKVDKSPIGLIYMDRKKNRPKLDQSRVKAIRLFRDFAVMAIRKISKKLR